MPTRTRAIGEGHCNMMAVVAEVWGVKRVLTELQEQGIYQASFCGSCSVTGGKHWDLGESS